LHATKLDGTMILGEKDLIRINIYYAAKNWAANANFHDIFTKFSEILIQKNTLTGTQRNHKTKSFDQNMIILKIRSYIYGIK